MPIRDATLAEHQLAAHDIRLLVQEAPDRLLYAPGHALWGLAVSGDDTALLAVDGALSIAALHWPGHIHPGARYALDRLVRRLADDLPLVQRPPGALLACAEPGAACGRLCVRLALGGLRWREPPAALAAVTGAVVWQAPPAPEDAALVVAPHPWTRWTLLAPPAESARDFLAELPAAAEAALLPAPWRRQRLLAQARSALRCERTRLALAGLPVPAWMLAPATLAHAVAAWSDDPLGATGAAGEGPAAATAPPCTSPG